jgi:hypothetical protein
MHIHKNFGKMEKVLISFFLSFVFQQTKAQQQNIPEVDEVFPYFIEQVLPMQLKGAKFITVPQTSSETIAEVSRGGDFFISRLVAYSGSADTAMLNTIIRNTPGFRPPARYQSSLLIYSDTAINVMYEIQKRQILEKGVYMTVSGFVFSKDKQKCVVFIHAFQIGGATFEMEKLNGQWKLAQWKTEWRE